MKTYTIPLPFGIAIPQQGGVFAGIMRGPVVNGIEQPPYVLITPPKGMGECVSQWGRYGQDVTGATSRTDGQANTLAMLEAGCIAATQVVALNHSSLCDHADWYLPSLAELTTAAWAAPEVFDPKGTYWTSTQGSRDDAFVQAFELGDSYWSGKDYEHRVRACRRVLLESLTP